MGPPASSARPETEKLDPVLHALGFEYVELSPEKVIGRFRVTETCCQPFGVLHGGVSALVAESLASGGAHMASGFQRVAGINLCINHLRPARLGDHVVAEARPTHLGKAIQVWDVELWIESPSSASVKRRTLISTSRVTLACNLPAPEHMKKAAADALKKYSKL
ncbi:hypothetical protein Taro_019242 [Colocasia esculenta]|uniref:Thioesterase domain-containing protein n=1 Tax=Colocasia esculenta TaxID=4460 RepID=A0A843UYM0_COLES|nr:hypothetical protein [Colocasia esculenta]